MADGGGMDPCECVWSHEMAMQRLMNLLRNSQTACTDNECVQQDMLRADPGAGGFSTMMMIMLGWIVVATALYLLRPSTMRPNLNEKPSGGGNHGNDRDGPPSPPVM